MFGMLVKGLRINKICYFISKDFTKMRFDTFSIPHVALAFTSASKQQKRKLRLGAVLTLTQFRE